MFRFVSLAVALIALAYAEPSSAQSPYFNCVNFAGFNVQQVPGNISGAMATVSPYGQPIIVYNPQQMAGLTPVMRDFIFAHECAHHVLGHGAIQPGNNPIAEQDADCWGIQALVNGFGLHPGNIHQLQALLASFGPGDWAHFPGPIRAQNLPSCLY